MRKQLAKKHANLERWIISYADFTTLLLATFVVMYAVSSINSSKFQQMAESFSTAFMGRTVQPQDAGLAAAHKAPFNYMPSPVQKPIITREPQVKKNLPPALRQMAEHRAERLDEAYKELLRLLGGMIEKGQVQVSLQPLGVVIDINSVLLFESGRAELTTGAVQMVDQVASVLKDLPHPIQVNGFTDNKPIHTPQFDSNWDLSAARAIAVVKRLAAAGIDPRLLVGAGYGEFHPVAANDTPAGQAANRRVSIVVVSPMQNQALPETPLQGSPEMREGQTPPPRETSEAPAASAAPAP
jgi:chemotaxis protein MotB